MFFFVNDYTQTLLIDTINRTLLYMVQTRLKGEGIYLRLFLFLSIAACVFELGCANRVSPSGGVKDEKPPVVVKIDPANRSTKFESKSVLLKFDEFVTLNNPQTEIFISPYMKTRPDIKLRGKTLVVKFKQDLLPNTTYTINFGNSIKDLTEGNPMTNFEYAFSTGDHIDSLFISGNLIFADNGDPVKDALVAVYNNAEDSLFTTTPPAQISRTDEKGNFRLSNLSDQTYYLFALIDKNSSYFFDLPNESIAFYSSGINPADTLPIKPVLRLFNEGLDKAKIMERKNKEYGHIEIDFSKPIENLQVSILDTLLTAENYLIEKSETNDTLHLWYKDIPEFSPVSFLLFNDTLLMDTIQFRRTIREMTLQPIKYISNAKGGRGVSSINYQSDLWLKFNHPITRIDTSLVQVYEDSTLLNINKFVSISNYRNLSFNYEWKPEKKYKLVIPDSTITDYYGEVNEEITVSYSVYNPDTYGTLIVNLKEFDQNNTYILKLYDKTYKLLREEMITQNSITLQLLKPGEYKIVVVNDQNKNGIWDTGNYAQKTQPEPIFTPKIAIAIKEDWETEVEITLK
jgi:hypothetical protein